MLWKRRTESTVAPQWPEGRRGYATLVFLMMLVRQQRFHWFAPYCWLLGGGVLTWIGLG